MEISIKIKNKGKILKIDKIITEDEINKSFINPSLILNEHLEEMKKSMIDNIMKEFPEYINTNL